MTLPSRNVAARPHAGAAAPPSSRAPGGPNRNWYHRFTGPLAKGVDYVASAVALERALLKIAKNPSDQLIVIGLDGVLAGFHAGDGLPKVPGHIHDLLQRLGASGMRIVILTGRPPWEAQKMLTMDWPDQERAKRNYDIVGLHGAMTLRANAEEAVLLPRLQGTHGGPSGFIGDLMDAVGNGAVGPDRLAYAQSPKSLLRLVPERMQQMRLKPNRALRDAIQSSVGRGKVELLFEAKPYSVVLFTEAGMNEEAGEKVLDALVEKAKNPPYQLTPHRLVRGVEIFPGGWTTKAGRLDEIVKESGAQSVALFDDDFAGAEAMEELARIKGRGKIKETTLVPVYQPRGPHKRYMAVSNSPHLGGPPQVEDSLAFVAHHLPKPTAEKRK